MMHFSHVHCDMMRREREMCCCCCCSCWNLLNYLTVTMNASLKCSIVAYFFLMIDILLLQINCYCCWCLTDLKALLWNDLLLAFSSYWRTFQRWEKERERERERERGWELGQQKKIVTKKCQNWTVIFGLTKQNIREKRGKKTQTKHEKKKKEKEGFRRLNARSTCCCCYFFFWRPNLSLFYCWQNSLIVFLFCLKFLFIFSKKQ